MPLCSLISLRCLPEIPSKLASWLFDDDDEFRLMTCQPIWITCVKRTGILIWMKQVITSDMHKGIKLEEFKSHKKKKKNPQKINVLKTTKCYQ